MIVRVLSFVLPLVLVACSAADRHAARPDAPALVAQSVTENVQAFDAQPRMLALQLAAPANMGFSPATAPWSDLQTSLPSVPDAAARLGPGSVLAALDEATGWSRVLDEAAWEQTMRVQVDEDRAVGIILQWGFQDDAVAGHDYRVTLAQTNSKWRVVRVEQRFHCRRGIGEHNVCK